MPGDVTSYRRLVHDAERGQDRDLLTSSTEEGPALRDAAATLSRVEADEAAAFEARERYRAGALPSLDLDATVRRHLAAGESVHSFRASANLKTPGDDRALGYGGTLYLTSTRLLHIGQVTVEVHLRDIVETSVAGERLLITLRDAQGLILDVDRPRLLRTEIAAAMRGVRP